VVALTSERFPVASPAWELIDQLQELLEGNEWGADDARLGVLAELLVMLRETSPIARDAGAALAVVVQAVHVAARDADHDHQARALAAIDRLCDVVLDLPGGRA
jgi:hypothetical protein